MQELKSNQIRRPEKRGIKMENIEKYNAILENAKSEKRGLTADEEQQLETLKTEIENANKAQLAIDKRQAEMRNMFSAKPVRNTTNAILRAIAKSTDEVGDNVFVNDIVRAYEEQSPIWKAHGNIQKSRTGNAYRINKVAAGTGGYAKTEGNAGSADTGSTSVPVDVTFATYSSQVITIYQEFLEDAAFDVASEFMALGMSKSVVGWDTAAKTALEGYTTTIPDTAATTWAISDLIDIYHGIASRNRYGLKWFAAEATISSVLELMDLEDSYKLEYLGLKPENLIADSNFTAGKLVCCNPTLALSVALKVPVRVVKLDVSAGITIEVQPRIATALRDATAVCGRSLKSA